MSREANSAPDKDAVEAFIRQLKVNEVLRYGDNSYGGHIDVETDSRGHVVAVWFRCLALPFEQSRVNKQRAKEMASMYKEEKPIKIRAIEVEIEQSEKQA